MDIGDYTIFGYKLFTDLHGSKATTVSSYRTSCFSAGMTLYCFPTCECCVRERILMYENNSCGHHIQSCNLMGRNEDVAQGTKIGA